MLRGKTLVADDALGAMTSGVTMTTTLLAKDTAHKTVYPVFTAGGGFDMAEMQGGGDFIMVADPATFQVLPWTQNNGPPHTGWLLCDIVFTNGKPVPFSTRQILRDALGRLAEQGLDLLAGLRSNFISSSWKTRGFPRKTRPGRRGRRKSVCSIRAISI